MINYDIVVTVNFKNVPEIMLVICVVLASK